MIGRKIAFTILFWIIAALLVMAVHVVIEPISTAGAVAAKVLAIFIAAFAFIRVAPSTTIDEAMLVGVAWLLLDIALHIVSTRYFGWRWIAWVGVTGSSILHDVFLLSWVVAPTVFARRAA